MVTCIARREADASWEDHQKLAGTVEHDQKKEKRLFQPPTHKLKEKR
jgi:hypothetical protein